MRYEKAVLENGDTVEFVGMNIAGGYVYRKVNGRTRYVCWNPKEDKFMRKLSKKVKLVKIKRWLQ